MENKNNHENCKEAKTTNHKKHGLLMLVGCMLPIIIIAVLSITGTKIGNLSSLVFLICPLMHIGMILLMRKSGEGHSCHSSSKQAEITQE